MSTGVTGSVALGLRFTASQAAAFGGTTSFPFVASDLLSATYATSGTGADKINQFYNVQMTLGAGQTKLFNLYSGAQDGLAAPVDAVGNAITMATVKELTAKIMGNLGCGFVSAAAVHSGGGGSGYTQQNTLTAVTVVGGGTGYTVADVLTVAVGGGTATTPATITVTSVSSGVITGVSISNAGLYTANPTNLATNAATGGTGASATFLLTMTPGVQTLTVVGGIYVGAVVIHTSGGGSGYVVGDVLTLAGGTGTAATVQVLTVSAGAILTLAVKTVGAYTVAPTASSNAATGGTGSGCALDVTSITAIAATVTATVSFGGAVTAIASVVIPGSYVALPPTSAATTTGGGGSGCTLDLTLGTRTTTDAVFVEADYLTLGAATTNPWASLLNSTGTLKLYSGTTNRPGCHCFGEGGSTGYVVGSSSNNILKMVNSGTSPVTVWLIVAGATA